MRARSVVPASTRRRVGVPFVFLLLLVMAVPAFGVTAKSKDTLFQVKGLSQGQDPNGRVTLTIKRNARGLPIKVVNLKLSHVDSFCDRIITDQNGNATGAERTPGPEVSANVGTFKLTNKKDRHGGGHYSRLFYFSNELRMINGVEHHLSFTMDGEKAREASLVIWPAGAGDGSCAVNLSETLTKKK
jgi:hypothetical protein